MLVWYVYQQPGFETKETQALMHMRALRSSDESIQSQSKWIRCLFIPPKRQVKAPLCLAVTFVDESMAQRGELLSLLLHMIQTWLELTSLTGTGLTTMTPRHQNCCDCAVCLFTFLSARRSGRSRKI